MKILILTIFSSTFISSLYAQKLPGLADCSSNGCPELSLEYPYAPPYQWEKTTRQGFAYQEYGFNHTREDASKVEVIPNRSLHLIGDRETDEGFQASTYVGHFSKGVCKHGPGILNLKVRFSGTQQYFCALAGATVANIIEEAYAHDRGMDIGDALLSSLGAIRKIPIYRIEF